MVPAFAATIDWQRPWLTHIRDVGEAVLRAGEWRDALNAAAAGAGLRNHCGRSISFVQQDLLPSGTGYEAFISATGCVPTRENLHDFFNGLVWLTFPRIKVRLNALHNEQINRLATATADRPPTRGRLRDAATLFDENAALLVVRDREVLEHLRAHRWTELFVNQKAAFCRSCETWLFGHALMEKLVRPYKAITAHVWPVVVDDSFFRLSRAGKVEWLDEVVTRQLDDSLTPSGFMPLPVLGIPGWWSGQDEAFYADKSVFRPGRSAS